MKEGLVECEGLPQLRRTALQRWTAVQKLHSGFPPRKVDARGSADVRSSTDACLS